MLPPREMNSRDLGQFTTRPPGTQRDPSTRLALQLQFLGLVRAVRVHLHEDAVAVLQAPGEAREIRRAQAFLALAVQHLDMVVLGGQLVGELARAVRAVVVRHENVCIGHRGSYPADDLLCSPPRYRSG